MTSTHIRQSEAVARRCLEVLDQMTEQLVACRPGIEPERLSRLRNDLAKLVHWALADHGAPDIVARIRDCYRRCALDLDDAAVLRMVRGTIKGELRRAGIDPSVPDLDPALDPPTIILTTRRTMRRLARSASRSEPGEALDRKPTTAGGQRRPTTRRVAGTSPADLRRAFDRIVVRTIEQIQRGGRSLTRVDCVAAIYNDPAWKARFTAQVASELPPLDAKLLAQSLDGFFRDAFKGSYIERTDRHGHRTAHPR